MNNALKIRRKQIVIAIGALATLVGLLVLGMWVSDPNAGKPTPMQIQAEKSKEITKDFTARSGGVVSAEETWIALSEKRMKQMESANKILSDQLAEITRTQNEQKKLNINGQTTAAFSPASGSLPPPPMAPQQPSLPGALPPPPAQTMPVQQQAVNQNGKPISTIQVIEFSEGPKAGETQKKKTKNVADYLPSGAFGTVLLLSGMDAPTGGLAKTNPVPCLLRVMDTGQLPNYFHSGIKNCHVTGAAWGEISSERVHIRTETLSCVLTNGDIVEEKVSGYVAGEDGKAGLRGKVVNKQGALIAKTLLAGTLSGMGQSISQQYQQVSRSPLGSVTTVDPDKVFQSGLATGTSNALEKVADFYIARANETYPIIEIDANRIGEIILTGGTELDKNLIGNTRDHEE